MTGKRGEDTRTRGTARAGARRIRTIVGGLVVAAAAAGAFFGGRAGLFAGSTASVSSLVAIASDVLKRGLLPEILPWVALAGAGAVAIAVFGAKFYRAAHTMIGVDLGTDWLKFVEVSVAGGRVGVLRLGKVETPPGSIAGGQIQQPAEVGDALREGLRAAGIQSRRAVGIVSGPSVVIRCSTFPKLADRELRQMIRVQAGGLLSFAGREAVSDFVLVSGESTDQVEAVLAGATAEIVGRASEAFRRAKLALDALEPDILPAGRCLQLTETEGRRNIALVDWGAASVKIGLFKGDMPYLTRTVAGGGNDLNRAIMNELGVDWATAERLRVENGVLPGSEIGACLRPVLDGVFGEIYRSVDFFVSRFRSIDGVYLTGGVAQMKGLQDAFHSYLGAAFQGWLELPRVQAVDLMERFRAGRRHRVTGIGPEFTGALGLVLRYRRPPFLPLNLLPPPPPARALRGRIALAGILVTALTAGLAWLGYARLAALQSRVTQARAEYSAVQPDLRKVKDLQATKASLAEEWALASAVRGSGTWDRVLVELAAITPRQVMLTEVSADAGGQVRIKGLAANVGELGRFLSALNGSKHFYRAGLVSFATPEEGGPGEFEIRAGLNKVVASP